MKSSKVYFIFIRNKLTSYVGTGTSKHERWAQIVRYFKLLSSFLLILVGHDKDRQYQLKKHRDLTMFCITVLLQAWGWLGDWQRDRGPDGEQRLAGGDGGLSLTSHQTPASGRTHHSLVLCGHYFQGFLSYGSPSPPRKSPSGRNDKRGKES